MERAEIAGVVNSRTMPQTALILVLQFMAEVPESSRFVHLPSWRLANYGYLYLSASTVAWSPVRPAMHRIALRLLLQGEVRGADRQFQLASRFDRQLRRALLPVVALDPLAAVRVQVRRLARLYMIERDIVRQLLRHRPELQGMVGQLRLAAEGRVVAEDVSSSSEDEQ